MTETQPDSVPVRHGEIAARARGTAVIVTPPTPVLTPEGKAALEAANIPCARCGAPPRGLRMAAEARAELAASRMVGMVAGTSTHFAGLLDVACVSGSSAKTPRLTEGQYLRVICA